MGIKIHKLRFLIYGSQPPKGSRFKGTLDTGSLIGYTQYTDRDDAKGNEKSLEREKMDILDIHPLITRMRQYLQKE